MKTLRVLCCPVALLFIAVLSFSAAAATGQNNKEFPAKKEVRIKLVLSGCELSASTNGKIQVELESTYDSDRYEAIMEERGDRLYLKEKFYGDDHHGNAFWKIAVPPGTEVECSSATGDISVNGFEGELEGSSGTGDIEVRKSKGEFELNSGTGNVEVSLCEGELDLNSGTGTVSISDCKGNIQANSGTGNCRASQVMILDDAEFNSGTGNCIVTRPAGEMFDMEINSGTGDAVLDLDGMPLVGYFEFKTHARRGDIDCPVEFDKEERGGQDGEEYIRRSFTREKNTPRYFISTGTGTAELKL